MKKPFIFFSALPIAALLLFACNKETIDNEDTDRGIRNSTNPAIRYWLCVSFVDQNNKDLTYPLQPEGDNTNWKGTISSELYDLNVIIPNPPKWMKSINSSDYLMYNSFERYPEFEEQYGKYDGRFYLFNDFMYGYMVPADFQDCLTYKISCPTIFGDNSVHEIVAYWDDDPDVAYKEDDTSNVYDSKGHSIFCQYPQCTKALFDGKEVNVKRAIFNRALSRDYYSYFIDIVLDR